MATIDLFTDSTVLPFPECHIDGIIQLAFSDWLHSPSDTHLHFLHVFSWLDTSFLFSAEYYSIVWMYHSLFIYAPTEGHVGYFQVLAIINKATINIHLQVFVWT